MICKKTQNILTLNLETETTTNDMMTGNGDGVSMSNWSFGQHNQIQSAATYTSKLCISGSRIDA